MKSAIARKPSIHELSKAKAKQCNAAKDPFSQLEDRCSIQLSYRCVGSGAERNTTGR
jgi:hypothetical protein